VGVFSDRFREPPQASNLHIGDLARPQASREFIQYRKTGRIMAPVCLCGAALPEKMYGDRAKCKRVDEFGDVTTGHHCVHTVAETVREKKST